MKEGEEIGKGDEVPITEKNEKVINELNEKGKEVFEKEIEKKDFVSEKQIDFDQKEDAALLE